MTEHRNQDPIAQQYERWMYPKPIHCMDLPLFFEARIKSYVYWPRGKQSKTLDILIAGCGTREAALIAYYNPDATVVGIDVSKASLRHQKSLRRQYDLSNLSLHEVAIEDVASLERDFDLIFCHGVLHHLSSPSLGIEALRQVLRVDGVMSLMVYGKYGRFGVRLLQNLFRKLGLEQSVDDVGAVRATLGLLKNTHPANSFMSAYNFGNDSIFVDTFLNRRDVDYSVSDCLDMLRENGLRFMAWANNQWYYPDSHIPPNHLIFKRLCSLDEPEIWEAMELFHATNQHYFMACRNDRSKESCFIDFEGSELMESVPLIHEFRLRKLGISFLDTLDFFGTQLFRNFDGNACLEDCIGKLDFEGNSDVLHRKGRNFVRSLWRRGLLHMAHRDAIQISQR